MTSTSTGYVSLHTHTEHSALDGTAHLREAAEKAAADGNPALAITDHGTMGGAWRFTIEARKAGIKPILGIEAYLAITDDWRVEPDRFKPASVEVERDDDTAADADEDERGKTAKKTTKTKAYQHITLLASNKTGYENLVAMVNESANSYFKKPIMDFKLMKQYHEGVIALTGCLGGPVLGPVASGHMDEARANLTRIVDAFGHDNVYVEIMEHGIEKETRALQTMAALAAEFDLPLVATNDSHYVNADEYETHDAWLAIQTDATLDQPNRFRFHGAGYHIRTEAEMRALRAEEWWQTAVSNTVRVADRCEDVFPEDLSTMPLRLPKFDIPEEFPSAGAYLHKLVVAGAKERYGNPIPEHVIERLKEEKRIIGQMGFDDYFLIVWDVINWARAQGIRVGPGRGSAAGSAVSYCLGIVQVDPLENNLLFERFLEPGRAGMPDIDVDFEKGRRHEVLAYLRDKYGSNRVARIGSFSAKKTKAALKDAAKLLGLRAVGEQLSKAVPIGDGGNPYTFKQLADEKDGATHRFAELVAQFGEDGIRVRDLASGFAGTVSGESIHACGTLISDAPLDKLIPLRRDRTKANSSGLDVVTQWDGRDVDAFGLLKLDVLGLRNLDVVSKAVKFIKETTGEDIDPDHLPHPNTKGNARVQATWELLQAGRTAGVFQMESTGMSNLAQQIRPDRLGDLSAVVALFRPGPLSANMHLMYADRKNGLQEVDYSIFTDNKAEQDAIATVLGETYGVFVYQEQLMRLATVIAGFDAKGRSKLRKAVGKKIKSVMDEVGEALIAGAPKEVRDPDTGEVISPVFSQATAARVFDYMKGSADYLFNASHSYAYAQLAYVTAFLKANWPAEYGAAILATTTADDKRQAALRALREDGVEVLAPDVNRSGAETRPVIGARQVLLGLGEIKGVKDAGGHIVANREQYGPFTSLRSLTQRVVDEHGKSLVNTIAIAGLIEAGAMDEWGTRRGLMQVYRVAKQWDITPQAHEWGILERSARQRSRLGVTVGKHPMEFIDPSFWTNPVLTGVDEYGRETGFVPVKLSNLPDKDREQTNAVGVLAEWAEKAYSKGRMANFVIESEDTSIRCVAWDETLSRLRAGGIPPVGSIVAVNAKVTVREQDIEDEDGNVIETVTTKELVVSGMRIPNHGLVEKTREIRPEYTPLREFSAVEVRELRQEIDAAAAAAASEPDDADPFTVADVYVQEPASQVDVPVVVWDLENRFAPLRGTGPDLAALHDMLLFDQGVRYDPPRLSISNPRVHLATRRGKPLAYVYTAALEPDEILPATWPHNPRSVPTKSDMLFVSQPERAIAADDSLEFD